MKTRFKIIYLRLKAIYYRGLSRYYGSKTKNIKLDESWYEPENLIKDE